MGNLISSKVAIAGVVLTIAAIGWTYIVARNAEQIAQTTSTFLEQMVLPDAVASCEAAGAAVSFKYNTAKSKRIVGLTLLKSPDSPSEPALILYADRQLCIYHPHGKRVAIGSAPKDM